MRRQAERLEQMIFQAMDAIAGHDSAYYRAKQLKMEMFYGACGGSAIP
jgi:hypothetical protein